MQPLELLLFGVVSALALALIGTLLRPYVQRRRAQTPPGPEILPLRLTSPVPIVSRRVCPSCLREYSAGERFCPHDARDLVPSHDSGVHFSSLSGAHGAPGVTCSRCGRSYDGGKRFCAFDGEELTAFAPGAKLSMPALAFVAGVGKICPTCSQRFEPDATFCPRDGAELSSVN